jgi:RepB DNA-primase from phage plasmid
MSKQTEGVQFLSMLFGARSTAPVFVTSLANDRSATGRIRPQQVVTRDPERVEAFAARWDLPERALYFCVATLRPGITRRAKENLAELICLHADLDFKGIDNTREEIEAAIKRLPLRPHLVVFSGHGLHCYWLFDKALPANEENIARVERLLKQLANVLAGDPAVCECSRLMRLPGTHNTKGGEWVAVETISKRPGSYSLSRLEAWLSDAKPVLRRRPKDNGARGRPKNGKRGRVRFDDGDSDDPFAVFGKENTIKAPVDVEERLAEMHHHGSGDSGIHNTQLSVTAALLTRGWSVNDVIFKVLNATVVAIGPEGRGWDWSVSEGELRAMCAAWLKKHPQVFVVDEEQEGG